MERLGTTRSVRSTPNIKIQRPGAAIGFAVSKLLPAADLERSTAQRHSLSSRSKFHPLSNELHVAIHSPLLPSIRALSARIVLIPTVERYLDGDEAVRRPSGRDSAR
jgi:hypothetical protein